MCESDTFTPAPTTDRVAVVEARCGRRGCGHIHKYEGDKPIDGLAAVDLNRVDLRIFSGAAHRSAPQIFEQIRKTQERDVRYDYGRAPPKPGRNQIFPPKKYVNPVVERRAALNADEWTLDVTPKEIRCRGCRKRVRLSHGSEFHPPRWQKHRGRCHDIKRLRSMNLKKARQLKQCVSEPGPVPSYQPTTLWPRHCPSEAFEAWSNI
ncbi:hypothetical protein B0H11DRAFT_2247604 [Mycena galericulata]|nr:hypothetical protein B0H11DRAFT_2247604 [Mycena galericulata]